MLTFEDAKRVGTLACLDKLGRDFVKQHRDTACSAYGDHDGHAFCFVGISDTPDTPWDGGAIVLDNSSKFPYMASCNVAYDTGAITFLDCVLPNRQ
ncbi:MAG: hypothetical protein IJV30_11360 [Oscillospiraceae bacterium]|nr:hypothetical protein [Oscillospiraceae bacterium]